MTIERIIFIFSVFISNIFEKSREVVNQTEFVEDL